jgi:hypothetical protein
MNMCDEVGTRDDGDRVHLCVGRMASSLMGWHIERSEAPRVVSQYNVLFLATRPHPSMNLQYKSDTPYAFYQ